jgi:hypothetical protein
MLHLPHPQICLIMLLIKRKDGNAGAQRFQPQNPGLERTALEDSLYTIIDDLHLAGEPGVAELQRWQRQAAIRRRKMGESCAR